MNVNKFQINVKDQNHNVVNNRLNNGNNNGLNKGSEKKKKGDNCC